MNAVVHGGEAVIRADDEAIQAWITDQGSGIQIAELPRATLERGDSTKDSLGHGFWMMLRAADTVHLLTGGGGTRIVLTLSRRPVVPLGFAA